jgi:hypothetical protein
MNALDQFRVDGEPIPGEEKIVKPPRPLSEYRYRTRKYIPEMVGLRQGRYEVLAFVGQNKRTESLFLIVSDSGFAWVTTGWQFKRMIENSKPKRLRLTPRQEKILNGVINEIKGELNET